jgi:adenosylcobinamide-phosphate synthase
LFSASHFVVAFVADALIGDPPNWPHLIRIMGAAVTSLEKGLRRIFSTGRGLQWAGGVMAFGIVGGFSAGAWLLIILAKMLWAPLGAAAVILLSFQCLAAGQLYKEARRVAKPLDGGDLQSARDRLAMIVGRETATLSAAGVRRALIETVAESINDGVVAPLFYLALGGPVAAVAYKAVNTLDSMIGYRNQHYKDLGLVSARLDDLAGWVPARITALLVVVSSACLGLRAGQAWRVLLRDHAAHKSPNAGWPEAAYAGALGIRLGGPNRYHGEQVNKPWINAKGEDPQPRETVRALRLMVCVCALAGGLCLGWLWLLRGFSLGL